MEKIIFYEIKETLEGKGLFAVCDVPAGQKITQYSGSIVAYEEIPAHWINHCMWMETDRWMIIESDGRYINHSCSPNCEVVEGNYAVTTRDVKKGEQFTIIYNRLRPQDYYDYEKNPEAYQWDPRWTFECHCGSPECQGVINKYKVIGNVGPVNFVPETDTTYDSLNKTCIVQNSVTGRSVIAKCDIQKDEMFLKCPVLVFPEDQWPLIEQTALFHYCFAWGEDGKLTGLIIGTGSFFNHSYTPNAIYKKNYPGHYMEFFAYTDIKKNQEIFINYNCDPDDLSPVWF